jgi:hypothetical protein
MKIRMLLQSIHKQEELTRQRIEGLQGYERTSIEQLSLAEFSGE